MAEYIEREELKKVLSNEAVHCLTFQKTGEARGLIKAKEIISKLPSADVVKVVRCKDCKYYEKWSDRSIFCNKHIVFMGMNDNDYCSYGELKERE